MRATARRTVLGTLLAILLSTGAQAFSMETNLRTNSFPELLLCLALLGGPGFAAGAFMVSRFVAEQEQDPGPRWGLRLRILCRGITAALANLVALSLLSSFFAGLWGLFGVFIIFFWAAIAGGVGLGWGCQLGLRKQPRWEGR